MDIAALFDGLWHFLESSASDPLSYSIIFFVYSVLAAIVLPLPVELGLFLSPSTPFEVKALIMGAGKAVGSVLVFYIGIKVGDNVRRWSTRFRWFNTLVIWMERLVAKLRYIGLYIILSIPIMTDTVPLYLFAVFNERGVFRIEWFTLVCFLAGVTRAAIVYLVFLLLGIKLL